VLAQQFQPLPDRGGAGAAQLREALHVGDRHTGGAQSQQE
jgi:hypothetical protein